MTLMKLLKDYGLLVLSLAALIGVSVLAVSGFGSLQNDAQKLYGQGFVAIQKVAALETELLSIHSLVRGVPAEMDLAKVSDGQKAFKERLGTMVTALEVFEQKTLEDGTPAGDVVVAYQSAGDKVFGFASSFAQDQANKELAERVEPAFVQLIGYVTLLKTHAERAANQSLEGMNRTAASLTWLLVGITVVLVVAVTAIGGYLGYLQQLAKRETQAVISSVTDMLARVHTISGTMHTDAGQMNEAAGQASQNTSNTASAVEQTSSSMTSVSAAVEELASTTESIAAQTREASTITEEAVQNIRKAGDAVHEMNASVAQIAGFADTITAIAEQTNLLALNAAIEAARAGDAGRGFAVVADEVRKLANQSNSAAGDIVARIREIEAVAGTVASLISTTTDSVGHMGRITQNVNVAVQEQQQATGDIARSVNEVSASMQQVSVDIESLAGIATNVTVKSGTLQSSTETLTSSASELKDVAQRFIARFA